ncbi:hypothetical protein PRIPAC_77123 [Pristionchus pacificus]|uniref:Uncharacterized protein n=1 Tax=Pristionchus pacificus TaxID=54126 RepID=A0A2A6BX41_PRIPA|nr:hypothetical protein PRIPAC_77123 [Pristionchus pacificus]|eukprot:PDM70465.1 hypothetical protein PRIPAC_46711 [Pristionchus pacificus]
MGCVSGQLQGASSLGINDRACNSECTNPRTPNRLTKGGPRQYDAPRKWGNKRKTIRKFSPADFGDFDVTPFPGSQK